MYIENTLQGGPTEFYTGNEVLCMLFDTSLSIFTVASLEQPIESFNIRCKIQLDHPVGIGYNSSALFVTFCTLSLDM